MRTHPTFVLCVLLALLACKKGEEKKAEPIAATPVAPAPPPATTSAAAPEESAPSRQQTATGLATPSEGTSKPPTVVEWGAAKEITVRHSTPLNCETKLVREW